MRLIYEIKRWCWIIVGGASLLISLMFALIFVGNTAKPVAAFTILYAVLVIVPVAATLLVCYGIVFLVRSRRHESLPRQNGSQA
jgi:membrane protein implicated in regulation of membrane protease activity